MMLFIVRAFRRETFQSSSGPASIALGPYSTYLLVERGGRERPRLGATVQASINVLQ